MSYAISVRGLSKEYRIVHQAEQATRITEAIGSRLRRPFHKPTVEMFQALDDVSFDVEPGEVLGIIGRNGAGKSTLLKILSRITSPTKGEVRMRGHAASLLEVGTGFSGELTGRENIYLNGSILGMRRREIDRQFDAIVDFAEVERFLDTPVKRYSSGMYVRLAFAVAAHLTSEILIVDEVLAVGDAEFQKKCLGKMRDVSREGGRTVLFVSHNMATIETLCRRALVLRNGRTAFDGQANEAVACYTSALEAGAEAVSFGEPKPGSPIRLVGFSFTQDDGASQPTVGRPLVANFVIDAVRGTSACAAEYVVSLNTGGRVMLANSSIQGQTLRLVEGRNFVSCMIDRCNLVANDYDVEVALVAGSYGLPEHLQRVTLPGGLRVHPGAFHPTGARMEPQWAGVVLCETQWSVSGGRDPSTEKMLRRASCDAG